jgi:tetratricopeptide (TPR) repeat protein
LLADAHVSLALEGEVLAAGSAYTLRARLVEPSSGESRFSTSTAVAGESDLVRASRTIAEAVLMYLQLETKAGDQDLRPWIRSRSANVEAVKAFLQASANIYRANAEEEPFLRRAIALDPDFVAPRVWLAISLNAYGRPADAAAHYERLKTLLPTASPFERAMIEFTGARLAKDADGQERSLATGLKYSPGNNILLFQLAGLQIVGGRCEEALHTIEPAIAMRWRYRNLYPVFGWCAIQTGRAAYAEPVLREAAEFEAPHPRTFAILEAIALSNGDDSAAQRYRARYEATHSAAGVTSGIAPLFSRLGRDCVALGRTREAERLFRRAAEQDPKLADPHLALGELAEAGGRTVEAVGHYHDYLAVETDAAKATVIRERIARLAKLSPVPKRPNAA